MTSPCAFSRRCREGVVNAAERSQADGPVVLVVDLYEGRVLDHCGRAAVFAEEVDYRELMRWALSAVQALADGFLTAGFFNGAGMAAYVQGHCIVGDGHLTCRFRAGTGRVVI
jgi:hypothetical protein